ncbi:putative DNA-binding transcriptional regulator YafY [Archangium gephyra]|uniref:DNA-binding transcriptional regulator YafY n=1 Tax=Archangium gephyra TaxID=48 RepID=A0AAC8QIM9_9BACT|nr:YafY family protein [Archangium gephyra]AKJ07746.1 Transcriptional regulator, DeoR family [Archangium gephyra]REG29499.1 putative DNA-binding transcriptional regulator YafY [Archangium gephyra]
MVQTSARLLKVLSLLQSRRFWAGGDLARELGVTERSVRRDVDRLRSLGYPVHAAAGVGGGYQLGAGKELPPLPLEDEEAVAVAVGLRVAASGPVKGLEEAAVRALGKLEQVLPKRLRRRVNALQAVSVRLGDAAPRVDAEALAVIANACRDSEVLRFDYSSREGTASTRSVEPYHLVHTSSRWYLLAYDLDREGWRTFRVDRIGPKPRTGRSFKPRPLPSEDVAAYVSQAVSTEAYRFRARVTVHAPARVVSERLSGVAGRIEELDAERCLVNAGGDSLEALAFYFAWLGFEFEVHEPRELIEHLRRLSERLARAAQR